MSAFNSLQTAFGSQLESLPEVFCIAAEIFCTLRATVFGLLTIGTHRQP
jgi:hypothetical protein